MLVPAMEPDCGCGGGANIKTLLKLCPKGKVRGRAKSTAAQRIVFYVHSIFS